MAQVLNWKKSFLIVRYPGKAQYIAMEVDGETKETAETLRGDEDGNIEQGENIKSASH